MSAAEAGRAQSTWRSFPIYHMHPLHQGAVPVDMDVGDLRGDILFDLSSRTAPLA